MGCLKELQDTTWDDPTDRTIYKWSEPSKSVEAGSTFRTSVWTNTVRNSLRQKAGEIEAFHALEIGATKWCKEHIPRKGSIPATEGGQTLLRQPQMWRDRHTHQRKCHTSRKRERNNEDDTVLLHNKGAITKTFTADRLLRVGESRDKRGE